MKMKGLTPGLTVILGSVILGSCVWPLWPRPIPLEEDSSITFPRFFDRSSIEVGADGGPYELDGTVLRAVMIAANDFLPPGGRKQACWDRQEAHRYQIIRQGNIIFVRIDDDLESCGLQYVSLDTGATYAISIDGRILRRMFDGQPGGQGPDTPDGGFPGVP
jgi:hypothetical protein